MAPAPGKPRQQRALADRVGHYAERELQLMDEQA